MESRQLTWMIGGAGLILCGVAAVIRIMFPGLLPSPMLTLSASAVYGASLIFLAVGLSRESSVVRRHPVGVSTMVLLAIWPLVGMIINPGMETLPSPGDPMMLVLGVVCLAVPLVAAVVAALQISRANVVSSRWRWAPLWAVGAAVMLKSIPQGLLLAVGPERTQNLAGVLIAFETIAYFVVTAGLGILAVVLAVRLQPAPRKEAASSN